MFARKTDIQIHGLCPLLSKTIKLCRTELNMSRAEFARRIRRSVDFVQELEQSNAAIDSDVLERSAEAFGLSVSELVDIAVSEKTVLVAKF